MGYRSDVYIGVAFANADDLKEVLAVYTIDPRVQKHNLLQEWEVKEDNILYYHGDYVKWYPDYDEVEGIEHMLHLVDTFHEERDMPIAYRFVRLGEEDTDMEDRYEHVGYNDSLIDKLLNGMTVIRQVEISL